MSEKILTFNNRVITPGSYTPASGKDWHDVDVSQAVIAASYGNTHYDVTGLQIPACDALCIMFDPDPNDSSYSENKFGVCEVAAYGSTASVISKRLGLFPAQINGVAFNVDSAFVWNTVGRIYSLTFFYHAAPNTSTYTVPAVGPNAKITIKAFY